jgi:hypothetical protein
VDDIYASKAFNLPLQIKTMSFSLDIIQSTLVKKTKPGFVKVYDYYDPGKD